MSTKSFFGSCLIVFFCLSGLLLAGSEAYAQTRGSIGSEQRAVDVKGTWSGTLYSKHSNVVPFTITVEISPDGSGHLIGKSSLSSDCLKGTKLQITVVGSKVVLAGSDDEGDNITVQGTLDASGVLLRSSYILNGSATGKCETDDGTGDLAKR